MASNYASAHVALIAAFQKALVEAVKDETDESEEVMRLRDEAFDLAKSYGWDWENDDEWTSFANKATETELIAFGLSYAIDRIRL